MLSKAHSVCVPSKIVALREFPLRPDETGVVYYTKPGRDGKTMKQQVRPKMVWYAWKVLLEHCPPYRQRPVSWVDDKARRVFEGCDASTASTYHSVWLEWPSCETGQEPAEDVGPAAGQHPGANDDDHETSSGFTGLVPAADVQASIHQAVANLRQRATGGSAVPAGRTEPVFHVAGGEHAVSEFDEHFFSMAFPELFLDGSGDFIVPRTIKLGLEEWLEHMMWTGDQRIARHKVFSFVAFSVMQRHKAMSQGSFFVSARMGSNSSNGSGASSGGSGGIGSSDGSGSSGDSGSIGGNSASEAPQRPSDNGGTPEGQQRQRQEPQQNDDPISLDDLNERVLNGDDSLARAIYYWAGNLRGSHAYASILTSPCSYLDVHSSSQTRIRAPQV